MIERGYSESVERALDTAVTAIAAGNELAVTCHINPDGDALGSALGFALAGRAAGKDVTVSFGEPFVLPDSFSYLPVDTLVPPDQFPAEPGVIVTFDAADLERLGSLSDAFGAAQTSVVVDHHITNEGFGDINVVAPHAAASAEIAYHLIERLGWPIGPEVATCLHTGLVTDTGRFQYSNTSGAVLQVAARLLAAGADAHLIGMRLYENVPFGYLQVAAAVQGRARLEPELSLVWSELRSADLEQAGISDVETEGLIDYIRIAQEADIAILLRSAEGGTKASLRSRALRDVGALAVAFGGGGHARAAGFTSALAPDATIEAVREYLREH